MRLGNISQDKTGVNYYYAAKDKRNDFSEFGEVLQGKGQTEAGETQQITGSTVNDYQAMLSEHISYLQERLQNGEEQQKIQIGNEEMTIGEWDNLLDNFDSIQEEILLGMRHRHEVQNEKQEREEALQKLFEDREYLEEVRTKPLHGKYYEKENTYFSMADESGLIVYNDVTFYCDKLTNTLKLGDCGIPQNCLIIPLEKGGSLMVNRNKLGDLMRAITMFSPEDQKRILEAIQKERMVGGTMTKLEVQKNEILDIGIPEEKETLTQRRSRKEEIEEEKWRLGI